MATSKALKLRKGRVETEVERLRAEGQWTKALELINTHSSDRSSPLYLLNQLILCENELDTTGQGEESEHSLSRARGFAENVLKTSDEQYKTEATILLGKIFYLQNSIKETIDILQPLDLGNIKVDPITLRFARIVSEGLAILGLCKEEIARCKQTPVSKKLKEEILYYYNKACHVCIRHLQDLDRNQSDHNGATAGIPSAVEKVIKKIPVMMFQEGDISGAISKYRILLGYCEIPATKSLRQILARQFAELLLRGTCSKVYYKYNVNIDQDLTVSGKDNSLLPHRFPSNRFIPDNRLEEAILALLISEHIASQDVILNRPSESSESQITSSFNNAAAVYDLLAIALSKSGHFTFLSKSLEKALKFSYRQFHIWYQFALSLISSKQYYRGYLALRECLRIDNTKLSVYLLASSLCLGHLGLIEEGMELASHGLEITAPNDDVFRARAHLLLGWGWSILARTCCVVDKIRELRNRAVSEYRTASQLDPMDYLVWYHLAVELATQRHLDEALSVCQQSLQLMPIHSNTLCLLALIHTAGNKRMDQAAKALHVGLTDRPNDFNLLFLLAKIEQIRINSNAGLRIYRRLLEVWRDIFAQNTTSTALLDRVPRSTLSGCDFCLSNTSDDYTLSVSANITPSFELDDESSLLAIQENRNHLEQALSSIAVGSVGQTGSTIAPITKSIRTNTVIESLAIKIQVKIYQGLAESYLYNNQLTEAKEALDEAVKVGGLDNQTLYLRGCLCEKQGLFCQARSLYESVIALKPNHLEALISLANLLHRNAQTTLAERVARDAMNVDPTNCRIWRLLAAILSSPNTSEPASETVITRALLTAIELEQTEPIEPFYLLPLGVHCT